MKYTQDELLQLAYGELESGNALELESEIKKDPEAARELAGFRSLKAEIELLKDIPAHQLSNERLKAAIGGTKPAPRAFNWSWLFAPVATAALAFMIVTLKNDPPSAAPQIVAKEAPAPTVALQQPGIESESVGTGVVAPPVEARKPDRVASLDEPSRAPRNIGRISTYVPRKHSKKQSATPPVTRIDEPPMAPPESLAMKNAMADPMAGANPAAEPIDSGTLVLIAEERDRSLDMQHATEVSSVANVIIGG